MYEAYMERSGFTPTPRTEPKYFMTKERAREYIQDQYSKRNMFRAEGWFGVIQLAGEDVDLVPEYVFADSYFFIVDKTDDNWTKEGF